MNDQPKSDLMDSLTLTHGWRAEKQAREDAGWVLQHPLLAGHATVASTDCTKFDLFISLNPFIRSAPVKVQTH